MQRVASRRPDWFVVPWLFIFLALAMACAPAFPTTDAKPAVFVAIGASDAVGVGSSDAARGGWAPRLAARLPDGVRTVNLGISGARVRQALEQQLPVALDAQPDLVVIWMAVNDFVTGVPLSDYERDLDRLVAELRANTGAVVAVANIPNLTALPAIARLNPSPVRLIAEVDRWNAAIARVADRHGALVIDLAAGWQELAERPEYVSADGFHPSDLGYQRMADVMWETLAANGVLETLRRP